MTVSRKSKKVAVRALKTRQGEGNDVYSFFLPGQDILRIADITRIERDEDHSLKGFQRKEIRSHVNSIVEFLDQGSVIFPNAIILALSSEVSFKQSRGPTPRGSTAIAQSGMLSIPIREEGKRVAWIVDELNHLTTCSLAYGDRLDGPDSPLPGTGADFASRMA